MRPAPQRPLSPRVSPRISPRVSRRAVLRGVGTAVALPLLEAMLPARARPAPGAPLPTRLVYVYVPNGVHVPDWRPAGPAGPGEGQGQGQGQGQLGPLPWILEPLEPFRREISVLGGLTHDKGRANGDGPGDHARAASTWLTGVQPLKTDGQVRLGVSADQVAARTVGGATRLRSLVLGCEGGRTSGQCDSGYACAYSHFISWEGPQTPAAKETSPRLLFDRLFRGGRDALSHAAARERAQRRGSVLDFVREDARGLERELGAADRRKLDEYLTGLRELERRIALTGAESVEAVPDELRPGGRPADLGEHVRLMADLIVLALATDQTRVVTFMVANEGSNRPYRDLGVSEGHHTLSHHGGDPQKQRQIRAINRYHVELLAHLLRGLTETREGARSLLDASMVLYGSGLADGHSHQHHDLPLVLCGRGNGMLHPGRHLRYPRETPVNDLHLALLERMGAPAHQLGDSTGVLGGI